MTLYDKKKRQLHTKFHVKFSDNCPYCKYLVGALMMYYKIKVPSELKKYVTFYDRDHDYDNDRFENNFGDLVPDNHKSIPVIIKQEGGDKFEFVGGLYDFIKLYS